MVNKFGIGTGNDVTNQRISPRNYKTTNFVGSWFCSDISRFVTKREARGFTLIELLVSMAIFAVITTAVVANFRASQFSSELRLGTEEVAQKMRTLHNMAQTGVAVELCGADAGTDAGKVCENGATGSCPGHCAPRVPRGGYGVYIVDGTVILFADGIGRGEDGSSPNYAYDDGEILQSVRLELSERLAVSTGVSPLTITFAPPQGEIWINGAQDAREARIMLQHTRTGQERTVVVRRISGRIEIE